MPSFWDWLRYGYYVINPPAALPEVSWRVMKWANNRFASKGGENPPPPPPPSYGGSPPSGGGGGGGGGEYTPPRLDISQAEAAIQRAFSRRREAIQRALRQALGANRNYIEEGGRYFGAEHGDVMGFSEESLAKGLAAYGASRDEIAAMMQQYQNELARAAAAANPEIPRAERAAAAGQGGSPAPPPPRGGELPPDLEKVRYAVPEGGIPVELFGGGGGQPSGFNYQVRGEHEPPPPPGSPASVQGPVPGPSIAGEMEALGREGAGYTGLIEELASAYHDRGQTQRQAMDEYLRALAGAFNVYGQRESARLATVANQRLAELEMQQQMALANLYARKAELEFQLQREQDPLQRRLLEQQVEMNDLQIDQARKEKQYTESWASAQGAIAAFNAASAPKRPSEFYEDLKRQYLDPILNDPNTHPYVKWALEMAYRDYVNHHGEFGLEQYFNRYFQSASPSEPSR